MAVITYKKYTLEQQIQTLKAQAEALEGKHRDLTAFLDSFKDPAMLEQQLKRRLNVKKKGEESRFTTVPNYQEIDVYLIKWIIKQTGIPREEFTNA